MIKQTAEIDQLYGGVNTFTGIPMQQTWTAIYALNRFIQNEPDLVRIVDLGSGYGGLTLFFGMCMKNRGGKVLSMDLISPHFNPVGLVPVTFRRIDIFTPEAIALVKKFLRNGGQNLIFCDDGHKPDELNTYGKLLKPLDFIMVHDFRSEITEKEVLTAMKKLGLEFYEYDLFSKNNTRIVSMRKGEGK